MDIEWIFSWMRIPNLCSVLALKSNKVKQIPLFERVLKGKMKVILNKCRI